VSGWLCAAGIVWVYAVLRLFAFPISHYLPGITLIALVATVIESLPVKDIDNLTVPLVSVLMGYLVF
jgi:phytol kinase